MASLVEDLLNILQTERNTYDQLYDLAQKEREAIIDRKLELLEETVAKEQALERGITFISENEISDFSDKLYLFAYSTGDILPSGGFDAKQ